MADDETADQSMTYEIQTVTGGSVPLPPQPGLPERIGRYRILRQLGEGGMGTVFEAEQDSPRRVVALKVIRPGAMSPVALRRFEHEQLILGRLQHPGIAQIYEAGVADGQPYFAMELVRGEGLVEHARTRKLSTRARLELMARICDAVEHAHQKGVIHRDLKPQNVVVDGAGQPKVLDFGVARVTDSDLQATSVHTALGTMVGSIAYMSPEQLDADQEQLDTRSDVYALGLMLWELLAGRRPFDFAGKQLPEVLRVLREEDVPSLTRVSRSFQGDVEQIVGKALSKEKARRYASAAEMAADLRRHLNDEPIVARAPSALYQMGKFARRHKLLMGSVAAVFVAVFAGAVASTFEAVRANRAEKLAEAEAAKARAVSAFLEGMLAAAGPYAGKGASVTVRELLDESARGIAGSLKDQPEVEAAVRRTLGSAYRELGLYDEAATQIRASLALSRREGFRGEEAAGAAALASLLSQKGDPAEAVAAGREAVEIYRSIPGTPPGQLADAWSGLASALYRSGDFAGALAANREHLALRRALGRDVQLAVALANVGFALQAVGDLEGALQHDREAIALFRETDPGNLQLGQTLTNLGRLLRTQGDLAGAEQALTESLEIQRRTLQPDHPDLAIGTMILGWVLTDAGKLDEAEARLREALELRRKKLGPDSPDVATVLDSLAGVRLNRKDLTQAEALAREALAMRLRGLGQTNPAINSSQLSIATILQAKGDLKGAEKLARQAVEGWRKTLGAEHPDTARAQATLGSILLDGGRPAEAEPLLAEALAVREKKLPAGHPALATTRELLERARAGR
jgi:tetratricopeptide (TPR) repeat protein